MSRLLACLLPLLLLCGFHSAAAPADGPVSLSVIDRDSGHVLPQHLHRGQRWVAGAPGHRYAVRLRNHSAQRVLVVLSVDGVNAITGATASPQQAGYVLEPWQTSEITGWRKSHAEVAQFVFTDHGDSYASRTGRPANVGVIGAAVFREKPRVALPTPRPAIAHPSAPPAPASRAAMESTADVSPTAKARDRQQLGTGHGEREWSASSATTFDRASDRPAQLVEVRYDDESRLVALGVLPRWRPSAPQAFPSGFVADPPPRRR